MDRRVKLLAAVVGLVSLIASAGPARLFAADAAPTAVDRDVARVELGRRLFFDPVVGREGRVGCASCHDPEHGFSDRRLRSVDETGELPRHSQPLTDLVGEGFHWDGEFDTVADVVRARVLPRVEAVTASATRALSRAKSAAATPAQFDAPAARRALADLAVGGGYYSELRVTAAPPEPVSIADRIAAGGAYADGFASAFGDPVATTPRVVEAIDAYVRSLRTTQNALDRFLAGRADALAPPARRGLELFRGRAGCSACHLIEGPRPLLTDGKFHDTGVSAGGAGGRRARTFATPDAAAFKTPSLRDVSRRAPYMHDGSLATLADVVRYYDHGGRDRDDLYLDARVHPLKLGDSDVADLVAFLESLAGEERAALGAPMPWRPARVVVRVETTDGRGVAGRAVHVRPFGDRLATAATLPAAVEVVTDARGDASFAFPLTTHVVLTTDGRPGEVTLPDWTSRARLVVASPTRVSLRVRFASAASSRPKVIRVYPAWRTRWADVLEFEPAADIAPDETLYEADAPSTHRGPSQCRVGLTIAGDFGPDAVVDLSPGACTTVAMPPLLPSEVPPSLEQARAAVGELAAVVRRAEGR
jgi:cytochrome c peroxidase